MGRRLRAATTRRPAPGLSGGLPGRSVAGDCLLPAGWLSLSRFARPCGRDPTARARTLQPGPPTGSLTLVLGLCHLVVPPTTAAASWAPSTAEWGCGAPIAAGAAKLAGLSPQACHRRGRNWPGSAICQCGAGPGHLRVLYPGRVIAPTPWGVRPLRARRHCELLPRPHDLAMTRQAPRSMPNFPAGCPRGLLRLLRPADNPPPG